MIRSFRLRIALLVTAVAGVALVGFSGVAWRLIYGAKVSQVDTRIEAPLQRLSLGASRPEFWRSQPAGELLRALRLNADRVAVQVRDAQGSILYESENWSPAFAPAYPRSPQDSRGRQHPGRRQKPQLGAFEAGQFRRRDSQTSGSETRSRPWPGPPGGRIPIRRVTRVTPTGRWRIAAARSPSGSVAIAVSLRAINQEMAAIRTIFLVAVPGTLLLVAGGAWGLSGSALVPIRRLTQAIAQITVSGLNQRVATEATDVEFTALIQVFNQMLERLERSFQQASRFSADAAHELKTPLAILQGELEQALQDVKPGSPQQQLVGSLLDEVRRLSTIVRKLLLLSLADAGQMAIRPTSVDLSTLVADLAEDIELLAPHLRSETTLAPDLYVLGDRDLLLQVLQNLVSNAIKYNRPEGWIRIVAAQQQQSVQVRITNAFDGILEGDRVFERFYRGDPSRNRQVEGLGLGLSLSREIAEAHGGSLALNRSAPGEVQFVLTLPAKSHRNL